MDNCSGSLCTKFRTLSFINMERFTDRFFKFWCESVFTLKRNPSHDLLSSLLRACSHEPGTVNYPGVMIAPEQALPRFHMMIRCPGATLPLVNFIVPGQVQGHLITTK